MIQGASANKYHATTVDGIRSRLPIPMNISESSNHKKPDISYHVIQTSELDGVVVYSANPKMQKAYRLFCEHGLGMKEFLPIVLPESIAKLLSPLSLKLSYDVINYLSKLIAGGSIKRIVCLASREELDLPAISHLVIGKDIALQALSLGRATAKRYLHMDVEFYLAEVNSDGVVEFYKFND